MSAMWVMCSRIKHVCLMEVVPRGGERLEIEGSCVGRLWCVEV